MMDTRLIRLIDLYVIIAQQKLQFIFRTQFKQL
jgi:hypothetical protein